jgi:hypothetical protein
MADLLGRILPVLQSHQLPGLALDSQTIFPDYERYNLSLLPGSISRWLGAAEFGCGSLDPELSSLLDKEFQHVILLLVDGLGLNAFQQYALDRSAEQWSTGVWRALWRDAIAAALTSTVPSTTCTALTSLWTGRSPLEHGVLGYELWLKEYSLVANMIRLVPNMLDYENGSLLRAGFDPESFLPVPVLGTHLRQAGILPRAFLHTSIAGSGLSRMNHKGAEPIAYQTTEDLFNQLYQALELKSGAKSYSFAYWSVMDSNSHRYGPGDDRVWLDFAHFSRMFERFFKRIQTLRKGKTLLLVTGDHGQVFTPFHEEYNLRNHRDVLDHLTIYPSGENRLAYLFARPRHEENLRYLIERRWPDQFLVVRSTEALQAGLMGGGQVYPRALDRVGDWMLIPRRDAYWWWADKENTLLGRHGGLSADEMLVPLLAVEI